MDSYEKHYSIDPGKGTKMEGCPYSFYEDGHDVHEFIIPPKGYAFTGFRFEPLPNNQIYDGKLVAQYEKVSVHDRLTSNLWKALIPVSITTVISVVVLLAVSIFREPTPSRPSYRPPRPVIAAADTAKPKTETPSKTEPEKVQEPVAKQEPVKTPEAPVVAQPETKPETPAAPKPETKPEVVQQPAQPTVQEQTKPETETPQVAANDPNAQFKEEFWSLIHKREPKMDSYHNLYVNNKGKVKGDEYDYLRFIILENTKAFKAWYAKLKDIPESQLQNINSVAGLRHVIH